MSSGSSSGRVIEPNPSRFRPAEMDPSKFTSSSPDLISILRNKDRFIGESFIQIRTFPDIINRTITRIQAQMPYYCGLHPICACAFELGLNHFFSHDGVISLFRSRSRFDLAPSDLPDVVLKSLDSYLNKFDIETPPGNKRVNPKVPELTSNRLGVVASKTGIMSQKIAILCLCHVMSQQDCVYDSDRTAMETCLSNFYSIVDARHRAAKALMDEFGVPELKESKSDYIRDLTENDNESLWRSNR